MTGPMVGARIAGKLSAIPECPRAQLIESWSKAHGGSPPKGISRRLLEYSAAYQAQVDAFGGQRPAIRRKLMNGKGVGGNGSPSATKPSNKASLPPGARLVREWHGRTHVVEVIDGGFLYDGQTYKSLSKTARVITGARWSGPRFFGL